MEKIRSETHFFGALLLHLLLTPLTLIQVLFGKKHSGELMKPFAELFAFIFEAKFTIAMILLNVGIYIWCLFQQPDVIMQYVSYPKDLLSARAYTLITSAFLHANLTHLLGNMLALFIFGRIIERKMGAATTAFIYFLALVISGIFSACIHLFLIGDNIGAVGASGAIMGLAAAAMLLDPLYLTFEALIPLPVMVVSWLTIYADITGIINPVEDGIGHFAHLGGFLSVCLLMFLLDSHDREKMKQGLVINLISIAVAAAAIFLFKVQIPFGL